MKIIIFITHGLPQKEGFGRVVLGNYSVGGGWEWWNERGLKGVAPIEREGIQCVERWKVVDGWDHERQETN